MSIFTIYLYSSIFFFFVASTYLSMCHTVFMYLSIISTFHVTIIFLHYSFCCLSVSFSIFLCVVLFLSEPLYIHPYNYLLFHLSIDLITRIFNQLLAAIIKFNPKKKIMIINAMKILKIFNFQFFKLWSNGQST